MKNIKLARLTFSALVFTALGFHSRAAKALTVDEATSTAAEKSHDLKELKLRSESSSWAEKRALSGYMPKLDLEGRHLFSEKFQILELEFAGAPVAFPTIQPYTSLALNASFDLFNGFATVNDVKAASLAREAAEHGLKRADEEVRVNLRSLFYKALGSQILVTVAEQNIETLEGHLKDVNSRVRSGVSTRFDSLRADVQLEDARTEKVAAESQVVVARARLFEAMGSRDEGQKLDGGLPEDFDRIDPAKIDVQQLEREDRAARLSMVQSLEHSAKAANAHWLPKVSVFGTQEWYNNTNHSILGDDERFKTDYAVGLQLHWNLFDGGAEVAAQRQAQIAQQIAGEQLAKFDESVPVSLEESKRRLSFDIVNYKAKVSSVRKAEEAVRLAKSGVRAGIRTSTEALDAVVDLNRAKAAVVKSQVDAVEALGQLELAIGHRI